MKMTVARVARGLQLTSLMLVAFVATVYGNTLLGSTRPGVLAPDEAATIYGAQQCQLIGGPDCAADTASVCISSWTGAVCPPSAICTRGGTGQTQFCYKVMANSQPSYACAVYQVGGNCKATCGSGCYSYKSGPWDATPPDGQTGCSLSCVDVAQCGAPICTVTTGSGGGMIAKGGTP